MHLRVQRCAYFTRPLGGGEARALIALILIALLAFPDRMGAQAPAALNIEIVEGDGAINNVRLRTAREAIVEVQDENHKPVSGALVLFSAKGNNPFSQNVLRATTDATGRVRANPLALHSKAGEFQIHVKATYRGRTARALIHQRNSEQAAATGSAAAAASVAGVEATPAGAGLSTLGILAIAGVAIGGVLGGLFGSGVLGGGKATTVSVGAPHF